MKTLMTTILCLSALVLGLTTAAAAPPTAEEQKTYADIQQTLGSVPSQFKLLPPEGVPGAWEALKGLLLSDTAIAGKHKELVGLAVAAQIPCRYCIYFHTAAARLHGASEQEIREALAMAALTRQWSTVLNGMQIDEPEFKEQLRKVLAYVKKGAPASPAIEVVDARTAYKDMERTLGLVPSFLRVYPPSAIAGAWKELKRVQLSSTTAIPVKEKELIGLAVAAQIPCRYCIVYHTTVAKFAGATDAEVAEAVAVAALVRHWSTVLNGSQMDEGTFRRETDRVIRDVKQKLARK